MTKTPQQMAKEYGDCFMPGENNKAYTPLIKEIAFLAGYHSRDLEVTSLEEEIAMLKAELREVGNE